MITVGESLGMFQPLFWSNLQDESSPNGDPLLTSKLSVSIYDFNVDISPLQLIETLIDFTEFGWWNSRRTSFTWPSVLSVAAVLSPRSLWAWYRLYFGDRLSQRVDLRFEVVDSVVDMTGVLSDRLYLRCWPLGPNVNRG